MVVGVEQGGVERGDGPFEFGALPVQRDRKRREQQQHARKKLSYVHESPVARQGACRGVRGSGEGSSRFRKPGRLVYWEASQYGSYEVRKLSPIAPSHSQNP